MADSHGCWMSLQMNMARGKTNQFPVLIKGSLRHNYCTYGEMKRYYFKRPTARQDGRRHPRHATKSHEPSE